MGLIGSICQLYGANKIKTLKCNVIKVSNYICDLHLLLAIYPSNVYKEEEIIGCKGLMEEVVCLESKER